MHLRIWKPFIKRVFVLCLVLISFLSTYSVSPPIARADSISDWVEKAKQTGEALSSVAVKASGTAAETALTVSTTVGSKALQVGKAATGKTLESGIAAGGTALQAGKAAAGKVIQHGETVGEAAFQAASGSAVRVGSVVGNATLQASKVAAGTAVQIGETVGNKALQAGKVAAGTTLQVRGAVGSATAQIGQVAAKETYHLIEQAAEGVKLASDLVAQNVVASFNSQVLPLLDVVIDGIDATQIESQAHQWQQEHPDQTLNQLAAHYIWNHARKSLLPMDWISSVQMQAEMVYEIAALFGLSLNDPARKAEIISISTLSLGSSPTIKAGVELLKYPLTQIPIAGDLVDLGSDSMIRFSMIHLLGHAACHYYETKLGSLAQVRINTSPERIELAS